MPHELARAPLETSEVLEPQSYELQGQIKCPGLGAPPCAPRALGPFGLHPLALLAGLELELGSCSGLELRAHDFSAGPDRVEHLEPWSAHNGLARQRRPGEGLGRRTHSRALLGGQLAGKTRVAK